MHGQNHIKFSRFVKRPEQGFQSFILWKLGINDGIRRRGLHTRLWQTDCIMYFALIMFKLFVLVVLSKMLIFVICFLNRRHLK